MRITSNTTGRQIDVNFRFTQRRLSRIEGQPGLEPEELNLCDSREIERTIREQQNERSSQARLGQLLPSQLEQAFGGQNYRPTSETDISMGQLGLEDPNPPEDNPPPNRPNRGLPDDLPERPPRTPTPPPRPPRRDPQGRRPSVPPSLPRPPRNPGGGYN